MRRFRLVIFMVVLSLLFPGPLQLSAVGQPLQPTPTPAATAASRGVDRYDVGAAALNVIWIPVKAATCGISAGAGALAFIVTLGAVRGWTVSAFEEGCVEKWLVTGADLRPSPELATRPYGD